MFKARISLKPVIRYIHLEAVNTDERLLPAVGYRNGSVESCQHAPATKLLKHLLLRLFYYDEVKR